MTRILQLDFETRSEIDLGACGAHIYAAHPSTLVLSMAYAFDDEPVRLWRFFERDTFPSEVQEHVATGGPVRAFNVAFERLMWNGPLARAFSGTGFPRLRINQTYCTMTEAYAMALPGKLENVAAALGVAHQKDMTGHRIMLQLSQPRRPRKNEDPDTVHWWGPADVPHKFARLYEYNADDVEAERDVRKRVRSLSEEEQALYWLDQEINDRGVYVDGDASAHLRAIAHKAETGMNAMLPVLTKGRVTSNKQHIAFREWVVSRGIDTPSLDRAAVIELLERPDLPDDVRQALAIRQAANKSSVAKLDAYLNRRGADGRMRGNYQFHGAGSTGRWAARGAQLQNIPRGMHKNPDFVIDTLVGAPLERVEGLCDLLFGPPVDTITGCLRGMLTAAPGYILMAYDYSNIEGRVLAWLAGAEGTLQAFRDFDAGTGPDLYLVAAAGIHDCSVDRFTKSSPERQEGKVATLACGFGGGTGAFHSMAKNYNVDFSEDHAKRIVDRWRAANPEIVKYWSNLERAAIKAFKQGGTYSAGASRNQIHFRQKGGHLWAMLPSGRQICYPFADVRKAPTPWGAMRDQLLYKREDPKTRQWVTASAYGGLIAENVTQAASRDILVGALRDLEHSAFPVVLHTHDEAVTEMPLTEDVQARFDEMGRIMSENPHWAPGLPIAVAGWMGKRYRKD